MVVKAMKKQRRAERQASGEVDETTLDEESDGDRTTRAGGGGGAPAEHAEHAEPPMRPPEAASDVGTGPADRRGGAGEPAAPCEGGARGRGDGGGAPAEQCDHEATTVRWLARAECLAAAEAEQRAAIEGQERTSRRLAQQLEAQRVHMRDTGQEGDAMTSGALQRALMTHSQARVRADALVAVVTDGATLSLPKEVWRRVYCMPGATAETPGHFVALRRIDKDDDEVYRADAPQQCWAAALWLMTAPPGSVAGRREGRGKMPAAFPGAMLGLGRELTQRPEGTLWEWNMSAHGMRYLSPAQVAGRGGGGCKCCKQAGGKINGCGTMGGHTCLNVGAGRTCKRADDATAAAARTAAAAAAMDGATTHDAAAHAAATDGGGPAAPLLTGGAVLAPLEGIPTMLTAQDTELDTAAGADTTDLRPAPRYRLSGDVSQGVVVAAAKRFLATIQAKGCFGTRRVDDFHAGFLDALAALTEARKTANGPAVSADAPGELRQAARDEAAAAQVAETTGRPVDVVRAELQQRRERLQRRHRVERHDRCGDVGRAASALESTRLDGAAAVKVTEEQVTRCGRPNLAAVPPLADADERAIQEVHGTPWVAPDKKAVSELAKEIGEVAKHCKRGTAAGHFGPVPDLLHRAIRAEPQMAWVLAAVFMAWQRIGLPATMAAAVAAVVESKGKPRVLSPPEALVRLFDKVMIASHKTEWQGCEALRLSHAHSRHGAPAAGVTAQTLVAGGWSMYKFDLRKGYNARGVRRLMRDSRRLGLTPGESRYFAAVLERRALLVRGEDGLQRVELADGRGGPQGLPFLPWVFSAGTCAFVEAALAKFGPEADKVVAIVYIDDVILLVPPSGNVVDTQAMLDEFEAQVFAAGEEFSEAVLVRPEAGSPAVTELKAGTTMAECQTADVLGVPVGPGREATKGLKRIAKAHRRMKVARELGVAADVRYSLVKSSTSRIAVYDAMLGMDKEVLSALDSAAEADVLEATGLMEAQKALLQARLRDRGLGVSALAECQAALVVRQGLGILLESKCQQLMVPVALASTAPFWTAFRLALADCQFDVTVVNGALVHDGRPLTTVPLAAELPASTAAREALTAAIGDGCVDVVARGYGEPGVTVDALGAGPRLRLTDAEFRALVRLHTRALEAESMAAGGLGKACPACTKPLFAGHGRWCQERIKSARSRAHDAIRTQVYEFVRSMPGVTAVEEKGVGETADGSAAIGDIVLVVDGVRWVIEVKTWDGSTVAWRGRAGAAPPTAADAQHKLSNKAVGQYPAGTRVLPLVMSVDGVVVGQSAQLLRELQERRDRDGGVGAAADGMPSLRAQLGATLARVEAAVYAEWCVTLRARSGVRAAVAAAHEQVADAEGAN